MLLLVLLLPPLPTAPLVLVVMTTAVVVGAGVPLARFARALAIPLGFLATSLPIIALSLELSEGVHLSLSPDGARRALEVGARALAAMSCLVGLALTTPMTDLIAGLRRLGVPQPLVEIMDLMYRLLFVVVERATNARRAQEARLGYTTFARAPHAFGLLIGALLTRSLAHARRLEIGLAARGFEGDLQVLTPRRALSARRLAAVSATLIVVGGVALASLGMSS